MIQTVWTIVNRNEYDVDGQRMMVSNDSGRATSIFTTAANWKVQRDPTGRVCSASRWRPTAYGAILAIKDGAGCCAAKNDVGDETAHGTTSGELFSRMESAAPGNRADRFHQSGEQRTRRHD